MIIPIKGLNKNFHIEDVQFIFKTGIFWINSGVHQCFRAGLEDAHKRGEYFQLLHRRGRYPFLHHNHDNLWMPNPEEFRYLHNST